MFLWVRFPSCHQSNGIKVLKRGITIRHNGLMHSCIVIVIVLYRHEFSISSRVMKCMEHEIEGSRPRGRPKKTCEEVVREDCQARKLNKEDAMDRCKWRKMIKEAL